MKWSEDDALNLSDQSKKKALTEDLLDNSFQSVRISQSTDDSLTKDIQKSFLVKVAPWLEEASRLQPYEEAALLLVYAIEGREMIKIDLNHRSRTCYHLRTKYHRIYRIAAWAILLIHIFELPIWTYRVSYSNWSDGAVYPSYQLPYLPLIASTLLQMLCVAILWIAVGLEFGYKQNTKNWVYTIAFVIVLSIQSISLLMSLFYAIASSSTVISAAPFSCFNILLVEYKFQNHLGYLLRTVPRFSVLLVCLGAMIVLYTSFAYFFFQSGSTEFEQTFPDFGTGVWNMLMIFDGSDWPTPMIPAFHQNRLYCLYFYFYIVLFNWGLLNLLLGFVYLFIRIEQLNISSRYQIIKQLYTETAFRVLDVDQRGFLTYHQADALIAEIYRNYMETMNPPSPEERYELLLELDSEGDGKIYLHDFEDIEEKCLGSTLRALRAKKVRFRRFISTANPSTPNQLLLEVQEQQQHQQNQSEVKKGSSLISNLLSHLVQDHYHLNHNHNQNHDKEDDIEKEDSAVAVSRKMSRRSEESQKSRAEEGFHKASYRNDRLYSEASNYGKISNQHLVDRLKSVEIMDRLANNRSTKTSLYRSWITSCCRVLRFKLSTLAMYIDSKVFDIATDSVLAVLAIVCFSSDEVVSWRVFAVYLVIACLESLSKLLVKGRFRFVRSWRSSSDGIMTIILVGIVLGLVIDRNRLSFSDNFGLQCLVLVRLLLLPRNVLVLKSFASFRSRHRKAFVYAFHSAGHIFFLALTMAAMLYGFAALGQQLFGGSIVKTGDTGEKISSSLYGENDYWPLNFNDMLSGLVTLFALLHVNNMHITTSGFVASTSRWAEVFFAVWYSVGVLLLLNVLIAVFVNQFAGYLEIFAIDQAKQRQEEEQRKAKERLTSSDLSSSSAAPATKATPGEIITARATQTALGTENRASAYSMPRSPSKRSVLEEIHSMKGGFDQSIFADQSYRASLLQLMKEQTESFSAKPSFFPETLRSSSFSASNKQQSNSLRQGRRRSEEVIDAWNSEFRAPSSFTNRDTATNPIHSSSSSNAGISITRPRAETETASLPLPISQRAPRKSQSARLSPSPALSASETSNPIFVSKDALSLHGNVEAEVEVTPEGEEEIVVNLELKLQDSEGNLKDASRESMQQTLRSLEQTMAQSRAPFVPFLSSRPEPVRMTRLSQPASPLTAQSPPSANAQRGEEEEQVSSSSNLSYPQSESMKSSGFLSSGLKDDVSQRKGSFLFLLRSLLRMTGKEEEQEPGLYEKAAILIQFARDGEGEQMIQSSRFACHCYKLRNCYVKVFRVAAALLLLLRFFERPLWVFAQSQWYENSIYPRFGNPLFSVQLMCGLKLPVLAVLMLGLWLELGYKETSLLDYLSSARLFFLRNTDNETTTKELAHFSYRRLLRGMLLLHSLVMLLLLFAAMVTRFAKQELVTAASFGSVLYFLWFNRRTFQKLEVVARILPKFSVIIALLGLVVLIFAGFGPLIFNLEDRSDDDYKSHSSNDDDSTVYFDNFQSSIWSVFVAITSSSWPNQILPSYHSSREVAVYFVSFICLGAFGLLNLVIVLIFVEFQKSLQASYDRQKVFREILLFKAFQLLDFDQKGFLHFEEVSLLCDEIYLNYSNFEKIGFSRSLTRTLLIQILDLDGDGRISLQDFLSFLDVMRIKLTLYKKYNLLDHYRYYITHKQQQTSLSSRSLATKGLHLLFRWIPYEFLSFIDRELITSRRLDLMTDCLGFLFFVLNLSINGLHDLYDPDRVSIFFIIMALVFYTLEMSLKILFRGTSSYFRSSRSCLDFGITVTLFLAIVIDSSIQLLYQNDSFTFIMKIAYLLRIFVFPRNLRLLFRGDRDVVKVSKLFKRIFFKLYTLSMVFFCVGFCYANLGCFLFGGVIDKQSSNEHFLNSQYVENDFWPINFNDMFSSFSTLFILLHVSDWDVIATGFTSGTSSYAKIYFALWYVIGVLFLLNVLKSFILGEFLSLFIDPRQNLPDFGSERRLKKKTSVRRGSAKKESDRDREKSEIAIHQQTMKENYWVSRQKLTNETLRNRLIARLNQSLFALNRRGLGEEEEDGEDDEEEEEEDRDSSGLDKREGQDHYNHRKEKIEADDDVGIDDGKPSFELPVSRPVSGAPLTYRDFRDNNIKERDKEKERGPGKSQSVAIPLKKDLPGDALLDHYPQNTANITLNSSFFREIDEETAAHPNKEHAAPSNPPNPEIIAAGTASYEGSETVVVSSLGAKRLDSEREQLIKQRLRKISANLRGAPASESDKIFSNSDDI